MEIRPRMVNLQLIVVTKTVLVRQFGFKKNVCNNESILRMEDRKRRTKEFLLNFHKSHFFVMNAESGELRWSKKCFVAAYTNLDENKIIWKKGGGFDPYIDFSCANIASKFTTKSTRQCRRRFGYNDVFLGFILTPNMSFLFCRWCTYTLRL